MTASAQFDDIRRELAHSESRIRQLATRAGDARWRMRPSVRGAWSASECVQHLVTTIEQFLPAFDAALADTPRREAALDAPYRQSVVGRLFVWLLEPPYRIRFRTAPPFVPEHARAPDVDLDAFLQRHRELGTRLDTGRDRAIDQVMLPSPFDARVRYSIFTAFRVIPAHERRHLWQAEQALAALERS